MLKNKTVYGLVFSLITIFLSLFTVFNPEIIMFSGAVAIASYAISSYMLPKNYALFTPVIVAIIAYFLSNSIYITVFSLLVFFPAGYLLAMLIKRGTDIKNTLLYSVTTQVIAFGALISSFIYLRGGALNLNSAKFVFSNYIAMINTSIAEYQKIFKALYPNDIEMVNSFIAQFKSFIVENVVPTIPAILIVFIGTCVLVAFIITKAVLKNFNFEISDSLNIKNFKLSKSAVIFAAISFLIVIATEKSIVNVAFENAFFVLNGALFLAGIAFIINFTNFFKIVHRKKVISYLCIVFICLFGGATIVSFFGGVSSFVEIENFKKKD